MYMSDISIIERRMRMFAERGLSCYDLGFPEQLVLMHLSAYGASNQESIAQSFDIDPGAVAKTVAKLESKGLVVRSVNPQDRRQKIVELDASSWDALQAMRAVGKSLHETMFRGLSDEEVGQVCSCLARVAANLSEDTKEDI